MVWSSLAAGLCALMPIPFLDDIVLARFRRSMVRRLVNRRGIELARVQVVALAGGGRSRSCVGLAVKVVIYPVRKILRKILYFLAVKDAVDTFSLVFHQGYLLAVAVERDALGSGGSPPAGSVWALRSAIFSTLDSVDTSPLTKLIRGVFRNSKRLVGSLLSWARHLLPTRSGSAEIDRLGQAEAELEAASPEAEALLDRLLTALWAEKDYRHRLEAELARRLAAPDAPRS